MDLSNELVSQFAKLTNDSIDTNQNGITVEGTAVEYNGKIYVRLDGTDQLTPIISSTVGMKNGDRVTVLIKDHKTTVTGNTSKPSASGQDLEDAKTEISDQITEFEIIVADKVSVKDFEAEKGRIDDLVSKNVTITGKLEANEADIKDLKANKAEIGDLTAINGKIDNLQATKLDVEIADIKFATIENLKVTNGEIHNLKGDYADFKVLTTEKLTANEASIGKLDTEKLSAKDAEIKYANIDFANIGEAAIKKIFSDSGIIKDLIVSNGNITGELVGVTIKGDLIEAGTVKADKLVVKGSDGLYYKLNMSAEKVEAQQTDQNSLNGSVIAAKSITATKIAVDDLVAFGATIGGFNIKTDKLYSGVKESATNTTRGVYLDREGQLSVGDGSNFLRYFKDPKDGKYKLEISASSIKFQAGGTTGTLAESIVSNIEEFYPSSSPTSLTGGSWSRTQPVWQQGKYIWRRSVVTRADGSVEYSPSENGVCITGNTGSTGPKGDKGETGATGPAGKPGANGKDGKGILSTKIEYQAGTSGTTAPSGNWGTTIPSVTQGQYLWSKTTITYTDKSTSTSYSVAYIPKNGQNGANGQNGSDGKPGATGTGVGSIVQEYYMSTSKTTQVGSNWQTSMPVWSAGKYLWTRYKITYTNPTKIEYTSPVCDSSWEAVNDIQVGGRNLIPNSNFKNNTTAGWVAETGELAIINDPVYQSCLVANPNSGSRFYYNIKNVWKENTSFAYSFLAKSDTAGTILKPSRSIADYSNTQHTLTTEWVKYSGVINCTTTAETGTLSFTVQHSKKPAPKIHITHIKLELGNKPSDWTPAPEDVDDKVNGAQSDANQALEQVEKASAEVSILKGSIQNLVTDKNGSSLMTQKGDGWTFDLSPVQEQINNAVNSAIASGNVAEEAKNIATKTDKLANDIAKKTAYINMTTDDKQRPVLELGKQDNPFKVRITNESIDFMEGTNKIAYITNQKLYIRSSVVTDQMQIGDDIDGFSWKKRENGNLGLRRVKYNNQISYSDWRVV